MTCPLHCFGVYSESAVPCQAVHDHASDGDNVSLDQLNGWIDPSIVLNMCPWTGGFGPISTCSDCSSLANDLPYIQPAERPPPQQLRQLIKFATTAATQQRQNSMGKRVVITVHALRTVQKFHVPNWIENGAALSARLCHLQSEGARRSSPVVGVPVFSASKTDSGPHSQIFIPRQGAPTLFNQNHNERRRHI